MFFIQRQWTPLAAVVMAFSILSWIIVGVVVSSTPYIDSNFFGVSWSCHIVEWVLFYFALYYLLGLDAPSWEWKLLADCFHYSFDDWRQGFVFWCNWTWSFIQAWTYFARGSLVGFPFYHCRDFFFFFFRWIRRLSIPAILTTSRHPIKPSSH